MAFQFSQSVYDIIGLRIVHVGIVNAVLKTPKRYAFFRTRSLNRKIILPSDSTRQGQYIGHYCLRKLIWRFEWTRQIRFIYPKIAALPELESWAGTKYTKLLYNNTYWCLCEKYQQPRQKSISCQKSDNSDRFLSIRFNGNLQSC